MTTLDTYNGWKNRETWVVNLWLTNEQGPYNTLVEIAESDYELYQKADQLKQFVYELCMGDDWSGSTISNGLVCDLVNQSLDDVDYREIILGIIDDDGATDDGDNCWDCGIPNDEADMNMCSECGHTLCWDCQGGMNSSTFSPHRNGRVDDGLPCGQTNRVF